MRHGQSPTAAEARVATDAKRPLSEKGRRDARRMAAEILRRGGRPALVLHSPLVRAAETAREAAAALAAVAEEFDPLDNTLPAHEALAELGARAGDVDDVLAVGHQPQVGEIAALLLGASPEIRPAGIVCVELSPPRLLWALNADDLAGE
jgi:phosphohistidine phosphatase